MDQMGTHQNKGSGTNAFSGQPNRMKKYPAVFLL